MTIEPITPIDVTRAVFHFRCTTHDCPLEPLSGYHPDQRIWEGVGSKMGDGLRLDLVEGLFCREEMYRAQELGTSAEDGTACAGSWAVTVEGEFNRPPMEPTHLQVVAPAVVDHSTDVTYTPFARDGMAGLTCSKPGRISEHLYMNPSLGSDDGMPTVFVYLGTEGDPAQDGAVHHYDLDSLE